MSGSPSKVLLTASIVAKLADCKHAVSAHKPHPHLQLCKKLRHAISKQINLKKPSRTKSLTNYSVKFYISIIKEESSIGT